MSARTDDIAGYAVGWLEARRDAGAAASMTAYMKLEARGDRNAFIGVRKDVAKELHRELKRRFRPQTEEALLANVDALWAPPWRESKYAALDHGRAFQTLLTPAALPLIERLVVEGAWWDLVDPIGTWLVSPLYLRARAEVRPTLDRWRASEVRWLRRCVLLAHVKHADETDERALFADIEALAHAEDFFIQKAIGWALRDYSYSAPEAVKRFLLGHRERLSALSFREGAKQLVRAGRMSA